MNGVFSTVATSSLLASMVILAVVGIKAIYKQAGVGGYLVLAGSVLSLACYVLVLFGVPSMPDVAYTSESGSSYWYFISEIKYTLLPIGHLITAIGVYVLVQRKIS